MPFCPWSQMSQSSRSFCTRPLLHLTGILTGWSLLMAWVIHGLAFCHSHHTFCRASVSRSPLPQRSSPFSIWRFSFLPPTLSACLFHVYYSNLLQQSIMLGGFIPYSFCFYCTAYTLKTKIPIFGFLPLGFSCFSKLIYSIALNQNILQTELCISFEIHSLGIIFILRNKCGLWFRVMV